MMPIRPIPSMRTALVGLALLVAGCTAPPAPTSPNVSAGHSAAPVADWAADLDRALAELEAIHPEPFHAASRDAFVAALDAYEAELPALTPDESIVELMRVWAMLARERDGHQFALPQPSDADPMLPIRIYEFSDGPFVTAAADEAGAALVGGRITAIGATPIGTVLERVDPLVPRDGPQTVPAHRPVLLLHAAVLRGLGLAAGPTVRVSVRHADGSTVSADLEPMGADAYTAWAGPFGTIQLPIDERVRYLDSAESFEAELLDDGSAYLRFRFVELPVLTQVRDWLDEGLVTRLVLDLRQNPGGDTGTYENLLALIVDFADANPGAVTVLIDQVTFSAASNLATEIERRTDATFVGQAMGGAPNFWNDVDWIRLDSLPVPMQLGVSTRYWQLSTPDDPRLTIDPDVPVDVTADDYLAGRDPALEAALAR